MANLWGRVCFLIFTAVGVAAAQTQTEFSVERFRMATDRGGLFDVEGDVPAKGVWDVSLWLGLVDDPLVLRSDDGTQVSVLVHRRFGGEVGLSYSLANWLGLAVSVPYVASQKAGANTLLSGDLESLGIGDVKFSPKLQLMRGVALVPNVIVPTANSEDFFGRGKLVLEPELALQARLGKLRLMLNGGLRWSKASATLLDLTVENELIARAGVGFAVTPRFEIGVTSHASTSLKKPFSDKNQQSVEIFGGLQMRLLSRVQAFIGGGTGLARGYGSPDWRVAAGLRIGAGGATTQPVERRLARDGDRDGDGIVDKKDQCPDEPENQDGVADADGCPEAAVATDQDGDGLIDSQDKCPKEAEDKDEFEDTDGCLDPDNDNDGIFDPQDQCVNEPGIAVNRGCPDRDRDGDTVVDRLDNCPDEPGRPKFAGCKIKQLVMMQDGKIDILDRVFFKTNKAAILPRSFKLLDNVARVILAHPESGVVRVEGHTDDRGNDDANQRLSQARAESVVRYMIKRGVPAERLNAVGYGEAKPIADNGTNAGRSTNRRVEFVLEGVDSSNTGPSRESMD